MKPADAAFAGKAFSGRVLIVLPFRFDVEKSDVAKPRPRGMCFPRIPEIAPWGISCTYMLPDEKLWLDKAAVEAG